MANAFEKVIDLLNKPLPGTAKKKTAAPAAKKATVPAAKKIEVQPTAPVKAIDVQAELRKRDRQIQSATTKADAATQRELLKARRELFNLRRQYEKEVAKQAEAHAKTDDWTYTVVPGDTLSGIAKKQYGDATKWTEIHKANKAKIKNPILIFPGQTLIIPDLDD